MGRFLYTNIAYFSFNHLYILLPHPAWKTDLIREHMSNLSGVMSVILCIQQKHRSSMQRDGPRASQFSARPMLLIRHSFVDITQASLSGEARILRATWNPDIQSDKLVNTYKQTGSFRGSKLILLTVNLGKDQHQSLCFFHFIPPKHQKSTHTDTHVVDSNDKLQISRFF